jgi:hypothetical protein
MAKIPGSAGRLPACINFLTKYAALAFYLACLIYEPPRRLMPHCFWGGEAFGGRQVAVAFENGPMCPFFKGSL